MRFADATEACGKGEAGPIAAWAKWPLPEPATTGTARSPDYDLSVAGVVTDRITQLTWQRETSGDSLTWNDAMAACDCLVLGGYDDWRLPSRIELASIVDFTRMNPSLDARAFPNTAFEWFWSASPLANSDPPQAWYVAFWDGNTHHATLDTQYRFRCVRGGAAPAEHRYVDQGDGTIADPATKLTWQQKTDGQLRTWDEAKSYCSGLSLAGGGWRLPNVNELQSLIDESRTEPAIDPIFPNTPRIGFWCSLPLVGMPPNAWFVDFVAGITYNGQPEHPFAVRCVR